MLTDVATYKHTDFLRTIGVFSSHLFISSQFISSHPWAGATAVLSRHFAFCMARIESVLSLPASSHLISPWTPKVTRSGAWFRRCLGKIRAVHPRPVVLPLAGPITWSTSSSLGRATAWSRGQG